jgi:hypothetical protein
MPAIAEVEGCAGLHTVIVYKLYSYQVLILIMLRGTQVATKHVLYGPICMLSLTICPGMVCRTELLADAKTLTQVVPKIASKLAATIRNYGARHTILSEDMLEEERCKLVRRKSIGGGHQQDALGKTAHKHKDCIMATWSGKDVIRSTLTLSQQ